MRAAFTTLLKLLLPSSDRGHVLADMEELYALKVQKLGRAGADAWRRRQTLGFVMRLAFSRKEKQSLPDVPESRASGPVKAVTRFTPTADLFREVRLLARALTRARGFLALSVLSLALGLGAATAIFTIANAVLLRPAPFREANRLVGLMHGEWGNHSYPNFLALQEETSDFLELAAYDEVWYGERADKPLFLREGPDATTVSLGMVSGEYFSVLGVAPALGRPLMPYDNLVAGGSPVAVLSWSFWERKFGGDPNTVGREISLDRTTYEVVGIAPKGFTGTSHVSSTDIWIPAVMRRAVQPPEVEFDIVTRSDWHWVDILGRLKPGVTLEVAKARLDAIVASSPLLSDGLKEDSLTLTPIKEAAIVLPLRERTVSYLTVLLLAVGLVVLVVCVNVTNLFLGRMDERRAEISIRRALGAGRATLARQFLLEAAMVASLGGVGALLLSAWLSDLLFGIMARGMSLSVSAANMTPDLRVLGFTFALVALCSLVIGGVSAVRHRPGGISALLRPGPGVTGSGPQLFSMQNILVTAQLTASIVLLMGAGLMLRSLLSLQGQDFGLEITNTLVLSVDNERIPMDREAGASLYDRILERVRGIPGVESAALAKVSPLSGVTWGGLMEFEGYEPGEGERSFSMENYVDPGFFQAMGIGLLQGRGFSPQDIAGAENVAIVNEALAKRYWPDANPLGKTIRWSDDQTFRVVGVVQDHFYSGLRRGVEPLTYVPLAQQFQKNPVILVKGRPTSLSLAPEIKRAVREIQPDLILFNETTLDQQVAASASRERVTTVLLFAYAGLALLLAVIGTYGVASRMVVRRWKELGIRTALGAHPGEVLSMVFRTGMRVVLLGTFTGLLAALAVGAVLRSMIFGVAPSDPLTLAAVGATLLLAGATACLIPARRALRADPAEVLRGE